MLKKRKAEKAKRRSVRLLKKRMSVDMCTKQISDVRAKRGRQQKGQTIINLTLSLDEVMKKLQERERLVSELQSRLEGFEKTHAVQAKLNALRSDLIDELTCPLSLCTFSDPVATDSGSIYEREYITKWFCSKQMEGKELTDPCMGLVITNKLTPLPTLKHIIEDVKENCFRNLDLASLEKALQQTQQLKNLIKEKSFVKVTVHFCRGDLYRARLYTLNRASSIAALKTRVLTEELRSFYKTCFNDNFNSSLLMNLGNLYSIVDTYSGDELEDHMALFSCGVGDSFVFHMQRRKHEQAAYSSDEEDETESEPIRQESTPQVHLNNNHLSMQGIQDDHMLFSPFRPIALPTLNPFNSWQLLEYVRR